MQWTGAPSGGQTRPGGVASVAATTPEAKAVPMRRLLLPGAILAAGLLLPATPAVAAAPTISGTVDLGGGTQPGVPVAWFEPGTKVLTSTTTDAAGHYSLPAPPAGTRYVVAANVSRVLTAPRAFLPSHLPTYTGAGPDDVPAASLVEPAVSTGADRTLDVRVDPATRVTGTNAAFAKRPVRLLTLGGREAATTTADAKGTWSFRVAPGSYRIAVFGTVQWLDYRSKPFAVPGGDTVVVRSVPKRAGTISGRLTAAGRPAAKVRVWLQGPTRGEEPDDDPIRTDRNGRFRAEGLVPGRFTVRFGNTGDGTDRTPYLVGKRTVTVASGRTATVRATLRRGATLDGRFDSAPGGKQYVVQIRRGGATAPLVRTASFPASTRAARNPVAAFGLPTGTYTVQAVDRLGATYATRTVRLTAGKRTDLGTLVPKRSSVVLQGAAPTGAFVTVSEGVLHTQVRAGADGRYRLAGLVPGRYAISAQLQGHAPATVSRTLTGSTVLDLRSGPATVVRAGTVTARLTAGAFDVPLADLTIDGGRSLLVSDGRLHEQGIEAGAHRVTGVRVLGSALFPAATPYDLAWPGDPAFTVPDGGTVDLGTIALDVTG